ncbi:hypothetical protein FRC03_000509 [Tulasnella sp. 419]|nr:hypothetical protein FRC03_000509 [Tulasnella sp. 419]
MEASPEVPPYIAAAKEVQEAIDQVPSYLVEYKDAYIERAERGDFAKLGSSQSTLSKHPTYPVLVRDEALLQKEYLKKLKSKFIEHSAKVQFLKFIRRDENQWGAEENEALEAQNQKDKEELRQQKLKLQESFDRSIELAKQLEAERPELIKESKEASRLAKEISEMKLELLRLARDKPVEEVGLIYFLIGENTNQVVQRMTVAEAEEILDNQIVQLQELDTDLGTIQSSATLTKASLTKASAELETLKPQVQKAKAQLEAAAAAKGQVGNESQMLSRLCEWYATAEDMYKDLVGLSSYDNPSENELRLYYQSPSPYTISLIFNPITKKLADAKLSGLNGVDAREAISLAVARNDPSQLLWYTRTRATQTSVPL